jgi:uncharacterized protein
MSRTRPKEASGVKGHIGRLRYLLLAIAAAGAAAGCRSEADRVTGRWQGTLDLSNIAPGRVRPGPTLRVVCNIQKNSDGTLGGSLDRPHQNATGIPIDTVTIKDGAFHLQSNRISTSYEGQLSADGTTISGQWKQGQSSLSMDLKKSQ